MCRPFSVGLQFQIVKSMRHLLVGVNDVTTLSHGACSASISSSCQRVSSVNDNFSAKDLACVATLLIEFACHCSQILHLGMVYRQFS